MLMLTFRRPLLPVRLHRDVRIQMVECPVRLLAALPSTLVHALDFFVAAAGALVLLGTGDRDERVNLGKRVRILLRTNTLSF